MNYHVFILCTLALTLGCFLQSLIGFGMGVIAAPVILLLSPRLMPSIIIIMGTILSIIVLIQYRKHLDAKKLMTAFLGRIPGTFLAAYIMLIVSESEMFLILGVTILITVLLSFKNIILTDNRTNLFIGGLFSGIMGTATGIGGPPIAILFQNENPNKLRANLSAFFIVTNIISLGVLHYSGLFSFNDFKASLIYLPIPIIGIMVAYFIRNKINQKIIRLLILLICSISAIASLYQGFSI
ncbi:TPA: sulfite exporter TauE/SafE family protein [Photobacterium damselae]